MSPEGQNPESEADEPLDQAPLRRARAVIVVLIAVVIGLVVLTKGHVGSTAVASVTSVTTPVTTAPRVVGNRSTTTTTVVPSTTTSSTVPVTPSHVTVVVLNATATAGAAKYFQTKLAAVGYNTAAPDDATTETVKTTEVLVLSPGTTADGDAVASALGLPSSVVAAGSSSNETIVPSSYMHRTGLDVIVIVGADIATQVH